MYRIHIHTEHGNTWNHGFSHTLPSVTTHGNAHALCVLSHIDSCNSNRCPLSDPRPFSRYRSLAATFALSQRPSLSWRLTRTFGIHCLHPCGARTLSPFKFTQQSTSLLSSLVGKNIRKVILFEWVILFKNPTVIVLIGNCIRRVNVFKGSLYS